jgi:predicted GIY-YIG superfamily endonuclease
MLKNHNSGKIPKTLKYKPWQIKIAIAFTDQNKAIESEGCLKSSSGCTLAKKRL